MDFLMKGWEQPKPLNIGLDYDDTYTADKRLWAGFVMAAKAAGHDVRFVTARFRNCRSYDNSDIIADSEYLKIPIIFAEGKQKVDVTNFNRFPVDIWIDDFPILIPPKEQFEGILQGIRVNDSKVRTTLTKEVPTYATDTGVISPVLCG